MFICTLALIVIVWALVSKAKDQIKKDDDLPPGGGLTV